MRLAKGASSASGRAAPRPGKRGAGVFLGGLWGGGGGGGGGGKGGSGPPPKGGRGGPPGGGGGGGGGKRQAATPSQWLPALVRPDGGSDRSSVLQYGESGK